MKTNRELLEHLKSKVSLEFTELRLLNPTIVIEGEQEDYDNYFEARFDYTGETYDVHVQKVDSEGIHCVQANDTNSKIILGLNDLSNIEERLFLVELMQIKIK